jgi:hypothetical protein
MATTDYKTDNGRPPTREIGTVVADPGYLPNWTELEPDDLLETNFKWQMPMRVNTVAAMRADAQVQGLITGTLWPIYRMAWYIDPNNADDKTVERISADLNLPIGKPDPNKPPYFRRTQNRFNFGEHLEHALDAVPNGVEFFEQFGEIGKDGLFHYKKLAPRPLPTIDKVVIKKDGGIDYIQQNYSDSQEIPITQLVVYSFLRRGANWYGRSILRGCYGPWLLKDRAMRVGVMNIQRAGVGTPIATAPPGANDTDITTLNRLMERFTAGERTGGAIPYGSTLRLVGVEGSQPDTVGFIKLMNEEMARAFFEMFMQLGQTTSGSRALGQTFVDYHKLSIEYVASWFANIFNEHVIEDDVEWNDGPDAEYAPRLCWAWNEAQVDPALETYKNTDPRISNAQNPGGANVPGMTTNPNEIPGTVVERQPRSQSTTAKLAELVEAGELYLPEDIRAAMPEQPEPRIPTGVMPTHLRKPITSPAVASGGAPPANAEPRSRHSAPGGSRSAGASLQTKTGKTVEVQIVG